MLMPAYDDRPRGRRDRRPSAGALAASNWSQAARGTDRSSSHGRDRATAASRSASLGAEPAQLVLLAPTSRSLAAGVRWHAAPAARSTCSSTTPGSRFGDRRERERATGSSCASEVILPRRATCWLASRRSARRGQRRPAALQAPIDFDDPMITRGYSGAPRRTARASSRRSCTPFDLAGSAGAMRPHAAATRDMRCRTKMVVDAGIGTPMSVARAGAGRATLALVQRHRRAAGR